MKHNNTHSFAFSYRISIKSCIKPVVYPHTPIMGVYDFSSALGQFTEPRTWVRSLRFICPCRADLSQSTSLSSRVYSFHAFSISYRTHKTPSQQSIQCCFFFFYKSYMWLFLEATYKWMPFDFLSHNYCWCCLKFGLFRKSYRSVFVYPF